MDNFLIKTSFFVFGILSVQGMSELPPYEVLALLFLCAAISYKKFRFVSCFLIGFVWATSYAHILLNQQLPKTLEAKPILLQGMIVGLPEVQVDATRFTFLVSKVIDEHIQSVPIKKLRLSWYGRSVSVKSGEQWQLMLKLKRSHGTANPYGFDFEKWLFQERINATGYVKDSEYNLRIKPVNKWQLSYWRESVGSYLEKVLADSEHLGIIKALVLGDRSGINAEQWDVFRRTGTSHLIAISGLHIGLVTALVFGFIKWITLSFNVTRISPIRLSIIGGLFAAVCYAALAGFSIPTRRALLMISVVMGAMYWQRHYTPSRVICVALWMVLLFDPLAVLSAGFWLSFGAVGIISYGLVGRLSQPRFIIQLVKTQFIVALGLLPFVVYFFQQVSLVAPLANVFAVPLVSLLLIPLLLIALVFALLNNVIGSTVLQAVDMVFDVLWLFLESLAGFKFAQWELATIPLWAACLAMLGVWVLLMPKNNVFKPLSILLFLPLLFPSSDLLLQRTEFDVVMLDVGQGLSTVVQTQSHVLVFDTGAKYNDRSDMASSVVIPYLKGKGVRQIDKLVISHGDNDHAGGMDTLLRKFQVIQLSTSIPEEASARHNTVDVVACMSGISWSWDGVDFEYLHPSKYKIFSGNNGSCVLRVSSKNGRVLLTGDIEKSAEQSLLRYQSENLKANVLIAPHHGSSTSSSKQFIEAVSPDYVLYPTGYLNRYGFPRSDVVERYESISSKQFNSAASGALRLMFRENVDVKLIPFRQVSAHYWNWKQ